MATLLKSLRLILALLAVITVLIVIPAWQLGVAGNSRVIFLSISYFVFFLGTVWRVVRYGQLATRREDRQVQAISGRLASLMAVVGLVGFHWHSAIQLLTSRTEIKSQAGTRPNCDGD